ncbi:glutathione S-transferase family protein [Hyphobacterium marinum]|uniref:Glutathione S-transferase n=1 Tax=Hyphobacterium marinum TaxID=3116574 RepID=A0ABU7LYL8_9PROT|nr:glutathione S-transferase [Hyphobacterium sp. Y6023]MEE2566372.1 glutathione S-transferase [Hyphobacterium sp. Y6023]
MLTVHHLENSRSQRVLWLLEEWGVPYTVKRYERDAKTMLAPDSLRAIHPLGKSPVIEDDGIVVAETGAILEYVARKYGEGRLTPPADTPEGRAVTYWLHYAEGSAMTPLLLKLVFTRLPLNAGALVRPVVKGVSKKALSSFVDPRLQEHIDYWEAELAATGWFAGSDMTLADIMMSFPLETAAARAGAGDKPNIAAFLKRIHARPAYQRALEKGGPYAYA